MKRRTRPAPFLLLLAPLLWACGGTESPGPPPPPTAEQLRPLLEEAASCVPERLRHLVELGARLHPDPEWDLPLTLTMWMLRFGPAEEFHLQALGETADRLGERLLEVLERHPSGPGLDRLSLLHQDLLTDVRLRPENVDSEIRGGVSFRLEGVLAGTVEFRARVVDGAWRVVEFEAPLDALKTSRQADGRWKAAEIVSYRRAVDEVLRGGETTYARLSSRLCDWEAASLWHLLAKVGEAAPVWNRLNNRIRTATWDAMPLEEVAAEIAKATPGIALIVDLPPHLRGALTVSLEFDDVGVRTVLDLITEPLGLVWHVYDGSVRITHPRRLRRSDHEEEAACVNTRRQTWTQRISFVADGIRFEAAVQQLRDATGLSIEIDPRLDDPRRKSRLSEFGPLTVRREDARIAHVLDALARKTGLTWKVRDGRIMFSAP